MSVRYKELRNFTEENIEKGTLQAHVIGKVSEGDADHNLLFKVFQLCTKLLNAQGFYNK